MYSNEHLKALKKSAPVAGSNIFGLKQNKVNLLQLNFNPLSKPTNEQKMLPAILGI